jgi:hypothetical protein
MARIEAAKASPVSVFNIEILLLGFDTGRRAGSSKAAPQQRTGERLSRIAVMIGGDSGNAHG